MQRLCATLPCLILSGYQRPAMTRVSTCEWGQSRNGMWPERGAAVVAVVLKPCQPLV